MKRQRKAVRGSLFLLVIICFIMCVPIKAKAEPQVISSYGSWIQGTNAYNQVYGKVSSQTYTPPEDIGEPSWFDKLLGSLLAYIGDFIDYWIAGPFHMRTDEIIMGRLADGVTMNMYAFELVAKNPYGLTGAAFYKVFRNMSFMALGIIFLIILLKAAIDNTPRALADMKNGIFSILIIAIMLVIAPQLIDLLLFLKDLLMTIILNIVYGSMKIETVSIVSHFRDAFFGNEDIGVEGTKSLVNGFLYLSSTFIGLRYGISYIKIALKQTALFIILPFAMILSVFNKNIMRGWNRRFLPNVFIPAIDLGLLMIPVVYAKVTSTYMSNTLAAGAAADYDLLSGIIQIIMMYSLIPLREYILEVFDAVPDRARPQSGAMGMIGAMMATSALRSMIGGGKGAPVAELPSGNGDSGIGNGVADTVASSGRIMEPKSLGSSTNVQEDGFYGVTGGKDVLLNETDGTGSGNNFISTADKDEIDNYLERGQDTSLLDEEYEDRLGEGGNDQGGISASADIENQGADDAVISIDDGYASAGAEAIEADVDNIQGIDDAISDEEDISIPISSADVTNGTEVAGGVVSDADLPPADISTAEREKGLEDLAYENKSILAGNNVQSLPELEKKGRELGRSVEQAKSDYEVATIEKNTLNEQISSQRAAGNEVSGELQYRQMQAQEDFEKKKKHYKGIEKAYDNLQADIAQFKENETRISELSPQPSFVDSSINSQVAQNRERLETVSEGVDLSQERIADTQRQQYERNRTKSMMEQMRGMSNEQRVGAIVGGAVTGAALVGVGATAMAVAAASSVGDDREVGRKVAYTAIGTAVVGSKIASPIANAIAGGTEKAVKPVAARKKAVSEQSAHERQERREKKASRKEGDIKVTLTPEKLSSDGIEGIVSSDGKKFEHIENAKSLKKKLENELKDD